MRKYQAIGAALMFVSAAALADDVSVSIGVNAPGLYGQINIGNGPRPEIIYPQPVVVAQAPEYVGVQPIYIHVPPGHEKHWGKHCAEYRACGRPVYFVDHDWYARTYPKGHRYERRDDDERHGDHDRGRHEGRDKRDRDRDREDRDH